MNLYVMILVKIGVICRNLFGGTLILQPTRQRVSPPPIFVSCCCLIVIWYIQKLYDFLSVFVAFGAQRQWEAEHQQPNEGNILPFSHSLHSSFPPPCSYIISLLFNTYDDCAQYSPHVPHHHPFHHPSFLCGWFLFCNYHWWQVSMSGNCLF